MKQHGCIKAWVKGFLWGMLALTETSMAVVVDPQALPSGAQVISGVAEIQSTTNQLSIVQSTPQLITHWDTFHIGADAHVQFTQPDASSVALNRVLGADPSGIYGSLSANGQVFLINPSGVIFGPQAKVSVGGLLASSLNIQEEDFLANHFQFARENATGQIVNQGQLSAKESGYLALLAPEVRNEGVLSARLGSVVMAGGDRVTIDLKGNGLVSVSVEESVINTLIHNQHWVEADGGQVFLSAKSAETLASSSINQEGMIRATSLVKEQGRIRLEAPQGLVKVSGDLDVSSLEGVAGHITVEGKTVEVGEQAKIGASGLFGGGHIRLGGGWQGKDTDMLSALNTRVAAGALIHASAIQQGDGGTIVAWSDVQNPHSLTEVYGTFMATGGVLGGNGGRIETSGHILKSDGVSGSANAFHGQSGEWLFDPYNLTISSSTSNASCTSGTCTPSADNATLNVSTINGLLNGGTSVTVSTATGGSGLGDLTVSSAISKSSGSENLTLTLQAHNNVVLHNTISASSGTLNVNLYADSDSDGAGLVLLGSNISTNGGNLNFGAGNTATINGVAGTLVGGDVYVENAGSLITLSTNGGALNVKGEMIIANPGSSNGLSIDTAGGAVRFYGLLNSGNSYTYVHDTMRTWVAAKSHAETGNSGNGGAVGDSYLATVTSRLENAVARYTIEQVDTAGEAWLGAHRGYGTLGASFSYSDSATNRNWYWVTGPEGLMNSQHGLLFFTQSSGGSGGTTPSGSYSNWNSGEPNNSGGGSNFTSCAECALQFITNGGLWNDLNDNTGLQTKYYVKETNLAASPVAITAGSGNVTFSGIVGGAKALDTLSVTSTGTIAINGGAVTTEGVQTYTGTVQLGATNTTLTQTNANTDFTLIANKPVYYAAGGSGSLSIVTTRDIILSAGSSISATSGSVGVTLNADSDANSSGAIVLNSGSSIDSGGGNILLSGGSNPSTGYAFGRSSAADNSNGITLLNASLTSGAGNITLRGKGAATGGTSSIGSQTTAYGIAIGLLDSTSTNAILSSTSGNITLTGYGLSSNSSTKASGIVLGLGGSGTGVVKITGTTGNIALTGDATGVSAATDAAGIVNNGYIQTTSSGNVTLTGLGYATTSGSYVRAGIYSPGNILSSSGTISLTGTGPATTSGGDDVDVYWNVLGAATGTDVTTSSSNVTINANTASLVNNTGNNKSSGIMLVKPRSASVAIELGGSSAQLSLPGSFFSTNLADGFTLVAIGDQTNTSSLTVSDSVTTTDALSLISAGNITLNGPINAPSQTVTLTGGIGSTVSGNSDGAIIASGLILQGTNTTHTLNNTAHTLTTLAASTGVVNVKNGQTLTVGTVSGVQGITATGAVTLQASGGTSDLVFSRGITAGGTGTTISLATGRYFTNNVGVGLLDPGNGTGARWLIYIPTPIGGGNTFGSLDSTHYAVWDTAYGDTVSATGNRYVFAYQPTITVTAGSLTKDFGQEVATSSLTYTLSDPLSADTYGSVFCQDVLNGAPSLSSLGTSRNALGGISYPIVPVLGTLSSSGTGYGFTFVNGSLTVNPDKTLENTITGILSTVTGVTGTAQNTGVTHTPVAQQNGLVARGEISQSSRLIENNLPKSQKVICNKNAVGASNIYCTVGG